MKSLLYIVYSRNVGQFVLFLLFTCPWCTVITSTCCSALVIGHLCLFLLLLLVIAIGAL